MKFRVILFILLAGLLSACNLTLAEDVTPPPDYLSPTPVPTLVLVPARTPNVANGAAIYAQKCAPCHGETGLGDGEQGLQLGVTVKAFGLPEIARPASPEQYYTTVTRGNMERLMPPFNSLSDQERWDVVAYVLTLHTTPEQVEHGKQLVEENCANCSVDFFRNQEKMSKLSAVELARLVRQGNDQVPAFGADFSDDDLWAVAAYLRTLSVDTAPLAQPTAVPATQTPVAAVAETPSGEMTPVGTEQVAAGSEATRVVPEGFGTIRGSVQSNLAAGLPSDLTVTLHGFEHATGQNAGAQEVLTQDGSVSTDGTYAFENVEMPEGRIFLVEAAYSSITLQSELGVVEAGQTALALPPITLYSITDDTSKLLIDEVSIFFHSSEESKYDVLVLYNFRNAGDTVVTVKMAENQEIPFLKFPKNAEGLGYEAVQDSASFISMDDGFGMSPRDKPYGIIAYSTVAKQPKTNITQEFALPVALVRVFIPAGMELKSSNLTTEDSQDIQGTQYQSYTANNFNAGDELTFEISGTPNDAATATTDPAANNNMILFGAGGVGALLILAGGWMYLRDRRRAQDEIEDEEEEDDDDEDEFSSSEEVLDAIIALDDLHRAKKISSESYQKRRTELKEILKEMM